MKSDECEQFLKRYEKEKPMFEKWGYYVQNYIYRQLKSESLDLDKVIKIKFDPRVKDNKSIIEKAFFRKNYQNAYEEITDKVGIRFVVMVDRQIEIIQKIIEKCDIWDYFKDNDYAEAIKRHPDIFSYQSVHYIVRNRHDINVDDIIVKKGTPCEIQIRTLEQHAYAELSHDYLYKQEEKIGSPIKRYMARSMALNETTDEMFSKVYEMIEAEKEKYYRLVRFLQTKIAFPDYSEKIDRNIYECLEGMIETYDINEEKINVFITEYYAEKIKDRQDKIIYQQPMIIIIYILAKEHSAELEENWCFTPDMLEMVFSDLGISSSNYY